ncbi:PQ-loop repeat-containing protein 1 [Golovinomyces cichoracearum]|uniref:PQ-loop repeat-containing protein 1 n=1 Tax=Golovinomyces cichoracearum TaxID=62708 RepID=A0A420IRF7_9PEZI|nr:PQ-loop repeat-containing protein 1 [Golovinomyces cichoracearum]
MGITAFITSVVAPIFIILSPITSYADQTYSIYQNGSSAGFSLDIPLIMLVASLLRVFYYPGAKFDICLLIQSFIMIVIQLVLLKVALESRPLLPSRNGHPAEPFSSSKGEAITKSRPYNFWQWRSPKPYWRFILYLLISLIAMELLLSPIYSLYSLYSATIGVLGLSVEAILPLPQIISNHHSRSCKGFRLSVLASWLAGDLMKMFWFFTTTSEVPWTFKFCGIFQMCCDVYLGVQYWMYKEEPYREIMREHELGSWTNQRSKTWLSTPR